MVNGQRLMQPVSDIFLGWTKGRLGRHFYIRQLRDIKIKLAVEAFGKAEMLLDAKSATCCALPRTLRRSGAD